MCLARYADEPHGMSLTASEEELRYQLGATQTSTSQPQTSGRVRGRERRENGVSVPYRRFPALAQFTDEELAAITMPAQAPPGSLPTASTAQLATRCGAPSLRRPVAPGAPLAKQ
jgi:hypothetical protein